MRASSLWIVTLGGLLVGCGSSSSAAPLRHDPGTTGGATGGGENAGVGAGAGAAGGTTGGTQLTPGVTCTIDGCTATGVGGSSIGNGGTGGGSAGAGAGGKASAGSGGVEIPDGPPGTVGSKCNGTSCDAGLFCSADHWCQPVPSMQPANIVQSVPPPDSPNVPSYSPIVLFMDGTYDGVTFTIEAHTSAGVTDHTGLVSITKLATAKMADIFVLAPKQPFPLGSAVVVTIAGTVQGVLVFDITHKSPATPVGAFGFEPMTAPVSAGSPFLKLPPGWIGFGDVAVTQTPLVATTEGGATTAMPSEGKVYGALTTGTAVGGTAVGATSSMLQSGPIAAPFKALTFDYDLHSAELYTYCGSNYDDTFLAVVAGPNGAVAKVVDSVDLVCDSLMATSGSAGSLVPESLMGSLDEVGMYGSGKRTFTLGADVGSPAVVAFVVTDVGDSAYTTLVAVDNLTTQ